MTRTSILGAAATLLMGLTTALPAHAGAIITAGTPGTTGATGYYATLASEISASVALTPGQTTSFLGAPNDAYTGLGREIVTYDFGTYRIFNGAGQDFNVYEFNSGGTEFNLVDILVSVDGVSFFNVNSTFMSAIDLAGDELHTSPGFRRSFDLTGAATALGSNEFRFLRLDGLSNTNLGGSNGFDLDGVGLINFGEASVSAIPEPATWAFMIAGFGAIGGAMRRSRRAPILA